VFISHSSRDKDTADKLCRLLEDRQINCWIAPRNVPPGAKYAEAIVRAIEDAAALVLILSAHSNASDQVKNEVERAVSKKKRIFPLKIDDVHPSTELELYISRLHWLNATPESLEDCAKQLAVAISQPQEFSAPPVQQKTPGKLPAVRKKTAIFGIGVILALFTLLAVWLPDRIWKKSIDDASTLKRAYQALKGKDWATAEALFQQMITSNETPIKGDGYAGMAALAFTRGNYPSALEYARQAEIHEPEIAYSHVVRGHILFQEGKLPQAAAEYRMATQKTRAQPWQKAIAHNRLGRIEAARGDTQKALNEYESAIRQDQHMAVAYANKGYILEKTGKIKEALEFYQQALQLQPDDHVTRRLLQRAEERQQLALDKEKQEFIDKLVSELVQLHKEGKRRPHVGDGWTSTPLTLSLVNFQVRGTVASREGEAEFILTNLVEALKKTGRIQVVDRETQNNVLAELKLSATELTDVRTALRVGKILVAHLIAIGKYTRFGNEGKLSMRVLETETTRTMAAFAEIIENPQQMDSVIEQAIGKMEAKLRNIYPLQARIARVNPQEIILNIGKEQGMTEGLTMKVFGKEDQITLDGKVLDSLSSPVGLIEVTRVERKLSHAKVVKQTEKFLKGWKVREVEQL
jgi:tetratricopeptide (TPR) repeat protein